MILVFKKVFLNKFLNKFKLNSSSNELNKHVKHDNLRFKNCYKKIANAINLT